MSIPEDGCYNFTINAADPSAATVTLTKVTLDSGGGGKETCGVTDQGLDNTEPYGSEMFVRGGFNDWENPTGAPYNFVNFGDGILQAEFELTAGDWEFKIADQGWGVQRAPAVDDILNVDGTANLVVPGAFDNGTMSIPEDGCYNFTINAADPSAATVTLTKVTLDSGGGGKETCGVTDQGLEPGQYV